MPCAQFRFEILVQISATIPIGTVNITKEPLNTFIAHVILSLPSETN